MNWNALKTGCCPKCGTMLKDSGLGLGNIPALRCPKAGCDFKISEKRLKEILAPKPRRDREQYDPDARLGELNNLGRREVREDFGDSPHLDY